MVVYKKINFWEEYTPLTEINTLISCEASILGQCTYIFLVDNDGPLVLMEHIQ